MDEHSRKTFSLSNEMLLTVILAFAIATMWIIGVQNGKIGVLQEKVSYLEDHDIELGQLKNELFNKFIKNKYKEE